MQRAIDYGLEQAIFEIDEGRILGRARVADPDLDPADAVRAALETPHAFPPLRRALTPGDRVAVVVDESLPHLGRLLTPLLEHIVSAGVAPDAITLLTPPSASGQPWLEDLPDELGDVQLEIHDARDRKRLSYLATTREGRRLYLNRTLVDADQIVVLSARRYDPLLGHGGAEGQIYPVLSDEETIATLSTQLSLDAPGPEPRPIETEAIETAWLLGLPFFVQIIEGSGDHLAAVVAGAAEASAEARRLQDERWRQTLPRAADVVVAGLSGDPARHTFADLAAAAHAAARVVQPGGRVVLLSQATPDLGICGPELRGVDEPARKLEKLGPKLTRDLLPALQWARAAEKVHLYVLSGLDDETVEDLGATPLQAAAQAQRLLDAGGSVLFLDDAHKALAIATEESES
jgi:nickel-dependent lactate racemase